MEFVAISINFEDFKFTVVLQWMAINMGKVIIHSENIFFILGIENVLHKLSVDRHSNFLNDVVITDSIDYLSQLNRNLLQSATIILFVENSQHLSIMNHFSFQQPFTILTMEEAVEDLEAYLTDAFCRIRRRLHIFNTASFSACQVWLAAREVDVLMLSCTEGDIDSIARKIKVSPKSVLNYRAAALKKMGVNFSTSLVTFIRSINRLHKTSVAALQN